jgi:hypothetical protein
VKPDLSLDDKIALWDGSHLWQHSRIGGFCAKPRSPRHARPEGRPSDKSALLNFAANALIDLLNSFSTHIHPANQH